MSANQKKIYIILAISCFILFPRNIKAAQCDYTQIAKLKQYAGNIQYDYNYVEQGGVPTFSIRFTNISKFVVLTDLSTGKTYSDQTELVIPGLKDGTTYSFRVTSSTSPVDTLTYTEFDGNTWTEKTVSKSTGKTCSDVELKKIFVTLPTYNPYYKLPECQGMEDDKLCFKWYKHELSEKEFKKQVKANRVSTMQKQKQKEEKKSNTMLEKIIEIGLNYYYIFFAIMIIVGGLLFYKKKQKEKLSGW